MPLVSPLRWRRPARYDVGHALLQKDVFPGRPVPDGSGLRVRATSSFDAATRRRLGGPGRHKSGFVTVQRGVRIHYLDFGGTGRCCFSCRALETPPAYDDFAPGLTDPFHVYLMTRRGFGENRRIRQTDTTSRGWPRTSGR